MQIPYSADALQIHADDVTGYQSQPGSYATPEPFRQIGRAHV